MPGQALEIIMEILIQSRIRRMLIPSQISLGHQVGTQVPTFRRPKPRTVMFLVALVELLRPWANSLIPPRTAFKRVASATHLR